MRSLEQETKLYVYALLYTLCMRSVIGYTGRIHIIETALRFAVVRNEIKENIEYHKAD